MTTEPATYRKKPVEIQAMRWDGTNADDIRAFTGHDLFREYRNDPPAAVYDELHDTWVNVAVGQWIIRGVKGEFYPCAEDVFEQTYDAVPADAPSRPVAAVPAPVQGADPTGPQEAHSGECTCPFGPEDAHLPGCPMWQEPDPRRGGPVERYDNPSTGDRDGELEQLRGEVALLRAERTLLDSAWVTAWEHDPWWDADMTAEQRQAVGRAADRGRDAPGDRQPAAVAAGYAAVWQRLNTGHRRTEPNAIYLNGWMWEMVRAALNAADAWHRTELERLRADLASEHRLAVGLHDDLAAERAKHLGTGGLLDAERERAGKAEVERDALRGRLARHDDLAAQAVQAGEARVTAERERAELAEAERDAHATARNQAAEEYRKLEAERDRLERELAGVRLQAEVWKHAADTVGAAVGDINRQRGEAQDQATAERGRADQAVALAEEILAPGSAGAERRVSGPEQWQTWRDRLAELRAGTEEAPEPHRYDRVELVVRGSYGGTPPGGDDVLIKTAHDDLWVNPADIVRLTVIERAAVAKEARTDADA